MVVGSGFGADVHTCVFIDGYGYIRGGYRDERESSSMRKREEERIHCRRCVCVSNVLVGVCSSEF